MAYKNSIIDARAVKAELRARMKSDGITISTLARKTGRKKEALRRLFNTDQSPRLDTFLLICGAIKLNPASLFAGRDRAKGAPKKPGVSDWALSLTTSTRWDDRLSTSVERRLRLSDSGRHRYIASILDDVPPEEYWEKLDLEGMQSEYAFIRPHLRRMRAFFDALLNFREGAST